MENETVLKEMLNAFNLYSHKMGEKIEKMDKKLNDMGKEMKVGFADVNKRLDRLTARQDGAQADIMETKETVQFLHSKIIQHEKKLHKLSHLQS